MKNPFQRKTRVKPLADTLLERLPHVNCHVVLHVDDFGAAYVTSFCPVVIKMLDKLVIFQRSLTKERLHADITCKGLLWVAYLKLQKYDQNYNQNQERTRKT